MKPYVYVAAFCGMSGVILGAFGAHGLKTTLAARDSLHVWETAVLYQLIHALAVLSVSSHRRESNDLEAWLRRACSCWTMGMLLFSGSLYWLALGGPRWLGPITPLGGLALILGWAFVAVGAFRNQSSNAK